MLLPPVALCLALLVQAIHAQDAVAPSDFQDDCFENAMPSPENEKVLLDSFYYASGTLLTDAGGNRTWLSLEDGTEKVFCVYQFKTNPIVLHILLELGVKIFR